LTKPGLGGIVASVKEGRINFQRILTYTMNSVTKKIVNVLFLAAGLIMTGHAILTPMLMVILMIAGDFLAMSLTTDNVRPSPTPNVWQIGRLTVAGVIIGICDLLFCISVFTFGKFHLLLALDALRTLALIALVFSGEASLYAIRERRRIWSSKPGRLVVASTIGDILIISTIALTGIAMTALPASVVAGTLAAAIAFAFVLDALKVPVFHWLRIS
jgi:H+-transporting ATPase